MESGGHSLRTHVSSNMANPSGVPAAGYHPVSVAHPRSSQCSSRQPVEKASHYRHRMVSAPQHSTPDVLHLVHSELELFATRHNNKLAAFVSPVLDPWAVAVDALSIPWDRRWVYAYPPTALTQRVLHKLVHSDQCRMLLVAPLQHYQPWLPMLLVLLVDFPRKVPPLSLLLRRPQSGVFHSHPEQVHLFAWSLSSVACESHSFQKQLPTVSARQLVHLLPVSMTVNGKSMRVGVVQNRLVFSKPLCSN